MEPSAIGSDAATQRRTLVESGICRAEHPAISLELFGSLRLKTGRDLLPIRADTLATAIAVLRQVCPQSVRLLPETAAFVENFRFSINGLDVTTDLAALLSEGDHVVLFSATVGG